jgi:hypothetical protein
MLTMRSKIAVRYSTAPQDIGYPSYPGQPETGWRNSKPEIVGVRRALGFKDEIRRRVGQGIIFVMSLEHNGQAVTFEELDSLVTGWEYDQLQKRGLI